MAEVAQTDLIRQPTGKRWRSRLVIALVLIAVVVAGVMLKKGCGKSAGTSAVRTAQVKRGTLVKTIASTGVIAAETGAQVKIGSQISGRIKRLYADLGDHVKAGQVIAEIDAPDLQASLESARRNLDQATARYHQQLQGVGMQHTQLASAFEQANEAVGRAEAQRDSARAAWAAAQSRQKSSQAAYDGAQARQKQAQAGLRSAEAAVRAQTTQTTTEVQKAKAGLNTAQASQKQVQKSADLQVASSQAALKQAEANASLAASNLSRLQPLLAKGFVSAQEVENARTQAEVTAEQVKTAEANVRLTREKVEADLTSAADQVEQAQASLAAAQALSYQEVMRSEDVRSAESQVDDAKAAVTQAQLAIKSAQADLDAAQSQVKAAEADVRSSRAALQTSLANLTQDKLKQQDVKAAYEAMRQAGAQVKYQQAQFQKSYIRSPISGDVVTLAQQEGETVAAGLAAPTLIEVVDLGRLEADAYVDETDIGQLRLGQTAEVTVDAYPNRRFTGSVGKIASAATMQENVVTYKVTVGLRKFPIGMLKPQMTTDVQITVTKKDNVLLVPNEAVKQREGASLVVVLKNGKPDVREVKTGLSDGESTEVLSGLQEGDTVVLAGFEALGVEGFSSAAEVPRFLQRTPFGGGGPPRGGGARTGGGGRP